eukprot:TRINITY_DN9112_c0_g2_i1.p1 TRINITY_DN9112_c0_g2~~TRINITY_DN9112_c0_g2_i1.p1  ORF type:complete len:543 (+),score=93.12 TRINITY_DN9112_c0_g2_i1:72-1700(+)
MEARFPCGGSRSEDEIAIPRGPASPTEVSEEVLVLNDCELCRKEEYAIGCLSITVLGASGDLAKKKTYPSLVNLFERNFLPDQVVIMGYARSEKTDAQFRDEIRPWLLKAKSSVVVDAFLSKCFYFKGAYDKSDDFNRLNETLKRLETAANPPNASTTNRLFYFAIPPSVFLSSAQSIKSSAMCNGFTRLIVEKPFGHDLASATKLSGDLGKIFSEHCIYRIDHYLGKEIVQNILMFRFGNRFLEPLFCAEHIAAVRITFKEDFGTEGRGGYFTNYGILRDIMQNHLMQVLSVVAMDPPKFAVGPQSGNSIRDAKVEVLKAIRPIIVEDCILGQYVAGGGKPGYLEDDSIKEEDQEKAEKVATFAAVVMYIDNERWKGVPFMIKAGKALDERKAEIRIQFKESSSVNVFGEGAGGFARNELVMVLQPTEAIYMKAMVKSPGLQALPQQVELDLTYKQRFEGAYNPDAYTRLILESLRGVQSVFVRSDEIEASWKLWDPLLKAVESSQQRPLPYAYGSRGPEAADKHFQSKGFKRTDGYVWKR